MLQQNLLRYHNRIVNKYLAKNIPPVHFKTCTACRTEMSVDNFGKKGMRYGKQAYQTKCKPCRGNYDKQRYNDDSSKILERNKDYYNRNRTKIMDQHREYIENNRDSIILKRKLYYENNKEMINKKHQEYMKTYYIKYPDKKLAHSCRRRTRRVLTSSSEFDELIGCDSEFLQEWILFNVSGSEEFTMENYGTYWHIDHVVPCAKWDLECPDQISKCFHWSNLAPLEAKENIRKKDKLVVKQIKEQNQKLKLFAIYKDLNDIFELPL